MPTFSDFPRITGDLPGHVCDLPPGSIWRQRFPNGRPGFSFSPWLPQPVNPIVVSLWDGHGISMGMSRYMIDGRSSGYKNGATLVHVSTIYQAICC